MFVTQIRLFINLKKNQYEIGQEIKEKKHWVYMAKFQEK